MRDGADVIVVGAGLAGLVATAELADAGRRVILLEQEPAPWLGGQAFWSFGGLFLVNSPEQRRLGVRDSQERAQQDWTVTAGFDRPEDHWPRQWAEAYVAFAAGEKRSWLRSQGMHFFPVVGWAERGGSIPGGPGNSVPRFHVTWGTGPAVVAPFERRVREAAANGLVTIKFRHRVDTLTLSGGAVDGVQGAVLEPSAVDRGRPSSRLTVGEFEFQAHAVIVTSGGLGGNQELVRKNWPARLGAPPQQMLSGVPAHVDGRMLAITQRAGGAFINRDRMWHYVEGIQNWNPIWPDHGIRILPGPSSMWFDALGNRLPAPLLAIRAARRYFGDRLIRVATPHRFLNPAAGPLIAVRLRVLTRKTLGGLQTDLSGRVLRSDGMPLAGLYAAGEVAGFGGGGMHGYRSLEGTFLGGCLFSGRAVGRAVAASVA